MSVTQFTTEMHRIDVPVGDSLCFSHKDTGDEPTQDYF